MSAGALSLVLPVRHDWAAIERVRKATVACVALAYPRGEMHEVLAMVVAELLENAFKYGDWSSGKPARLAVEGTERSVRISVRHPIAPGDHLDRLAHVLADLSRARSAKAVFTQRMLEVARQHQSGGLGLARIAHEAGCRLLATQPFPGWLEVTAIAYAPDGERPEGAAAAVAP